MNNQNNKQNTQNTQNKNIRNNSDAQRSQQDRQKKDNINIQRNPQISIVIPLFNEEESLKELSERIQEVCSKENITYEVLFIDDGSTDNSLQRIKEINRSNKRFKCFSFRRNFGKSAALNVGFKKSRGDIIITMDADLQDDPKEIPALINKIKEGWDIVSGWKKKRHDPLFTKNLPSKFFNFVTRKLSGIDIHDMNCGLKAYKKEVCRDVTVYGELHRYIPVLAKEFGYRTTEIPVTHHKRKYGKTKFGLSRFIKGFLDLLTILFNSKYGKRPLHLFGALGTLCFSAGFIINLYLSILWYFYNIWLGNRPLLFLGVLLLILGIQFFSIGLLGEMITRTNIASQEYSIKEVVK
ncbi:MAG TPA: glycosyltransferase family 2 protein [Bacteroidota bacterium]|jgi:glycosyltransferase involved in cell wall biosynthesis|nr:glycosyltransferase family 2 protein [Bacteroidota bacterium]